MNKKYAQYLLKKTKDDYNKIAGDFSGKRSYLSDDIKLLGKYASGGDKILDLGCGNGRLFELFGNQNIEYAGVDISEELINIAKNKYGAKADFQTADFLRLPFSDNYFDKIYCLSVFHHIPSKEFRLQFLKEAKRVLKPGGILVLTVWNFWQGRGIAQVLKYAFLKIIGLGRLDFGDIFISFKDSQGTILAERYYHCFTKRGLKKLFKETGFSITEMSILKRGKYENICLIGKNVI